MRFRIVCGLVLLLAHAAPGAQEAMPERVMTFSEKQDGSVFAHFTLGEEEAAVIQFLDEAGEVLRPLSIKVEDNGDNYIAGRVSSGVRLDFLPKRIVSVQLSDLPGLENLRISFLDLFLKRNFVSVPLFDFPGLQGVRIRLLVKANAGRDAATIAVSTEETAAITVRLVEVGMVYIPGGTFRMGDLSGEGHGQQLPVHSVTVPSFWMGKREVTFSQWDACVADGGCSHTPGDEGFGRGNRPVINVSWDDVQEFIAWLNARAGGGYRLPTESEWEYAARAGSETLYSWGDELGVNRANCDDCGSEWDDERTAPVGSFPANAWGLHDMHGNVWEWVEDCWNGNYEGAPGDGSAWLNGTCFLRVIRGGSWVNFPSSLRSSYRGWTNRSNRLDLLGFRLARDR